ncbi:MAG: peptidoglycan DD-metalloendopeptidase family protein [Renibacterium salmoninarum]|nr:peptidoglycan DD-metalloendopeptidase family protein [Renibacterium salmoninarum]
MRKALIIGVSVFTTLVLLVAGTILVFLLMMTTMATSAKADLCTPDGGSTGAVGPWTDPLPGATVTSQFGPRILPNGEADNTGGTDLAGVPEGTPFLSASAGTVEAAYGNGSVSPSGDTGNGIIIDAGDGIKLWYWHAQDGSTKVKAGDKVTAGQPLANVGNTGKSFGAHLHFQVMLNGQAVNAEPFMKARGVTLGGKVTSIPVINQLPTVSSPAPAGGDLPPAELTVKNSKGQSLVLKQKQVANFAGIIAAGKGANMSDKAIKIAIVTVLQESKGIMYANPRVPESLNLPYDEVAQDYDSVGIYQQRPFWGAISDLMDVKASTLKFFGLSPGGPWPPGLTNIPGWEQMGIAQAAQAVQVSAFPDAYAQWLSAADEIMTALGSGAPTSSNCKPADTSLAGQELPGATEATRAKIIAAAKEGLGGSYVWGGNEFKAWDCSGYVLWVMNQAGLQSIPRVNQWTVGTKTTTPQPGDLVVQNPTGPGAWGHVGIYAGEGKMYSALNASVGTLLHPVDWNPGSEYFTLVK